MKHLKNFSFLAVIFTILWFVSGCLGNYGKISVVSKNYNATIRQLKTNWDNYDILYAGISTDSPAAIMFVPRTDGKRLIGKRWMPVTEKSEFDKIVRWLESNIDFLPTLYEVLSPQGVFFGYIYASNMVQIVVKQIDPETLEVEDIPLPPSDYGPAAVI
ncbi:MAG: hypothetical protein K8R45_14735 [Desulfobacterales bacterium]|nr:hypothetical protein [Desulfobacterales bacterium]